MGNVAMPRLAATPLAETSFEFVRFVCLGSKSLGQAVEAKVFDPPWAVAE